MKTSAKNINTSVEVLEPYQRRAQRFDKKRVPVYRVPTYDKMERAFYVPVPVEQRGNQQFNNKPNGWPKSDISILVASSSALELDALLAKAKVTGSKSDTQSLTLEQKFLACKPRACDTPLERERFYDYCMNQAGLSEADLFDLANEATKNEPKDVNPKVPEA